MTSGGPGGPTPDQLPGHPDREVEQLLASPELAKAVENDDFKAFLDHLPIAVAVSRVAGERQRIVYANEALARLAGRSRADMEGRDWSVLDAMRQEDEPGVPLGQAVAGGEEFLGVFRMERTAGEPVLVQAYTSLIEGDDSGGGYRILALVDVSHHDRAQREAYERTIRSKDLALREIQHRVKNNLQLLVVLIRLEARTARRGDPVDLERLSGRIEALSLLHETLSTQPATEEVDLGQYLAQIAAAAMRAHASEAIRLDVKVNCCPVSVNIAMPAGFLVNELLTNAFKYAFQGRDGGCITLECLRDETGRCRIVVADDGIGLPAGMTWPPADKLGGFVLQTLSENVPLDYRAESAPGRGLRVTLSFTHPTAAAKLN